MALGSKLTKRIFRMLRNIFRASSITKRHLLLNRAVLARGSSSKKEEPEKSEQTEEDASNNNQQSSSKTRFGWNDLYMRSHYDSETKNKATETKEGLPK